MSQKIILPKNEQNLRYLQVVRLKIIMYLMHPLFLQFSFMSLMAKKSLEFKVFKAHFLEDNTDPSPRLIKLFNISKQQSNLLCNSKQDSKCTRMLDTVATKDYMNPTSQYMPT